MNFWRKFWPRKMLAQMILWVIIALLVAQGISVWVLGRAHQMALINTSEQFLLRQFASTMLLLEQTPSELHGSLLQTLQRPGVRYFKVEHFALPTPETDAEAMQLQTHLRKLLGTGYTGLTYVRLRKISPPKEPHGERGEHGEAHPFHPDPPDAFRHDHRPPEPGFQPWRRKPPLLLRELHLAAQLADGTWLISRQKAPNLAPVTAWSTVVFGLVAMILVLLVVYWQMRRITRPLRTLSAAASDLGRGKPVNKLPEQGPEDVRETILAFNRMNDRLHRFVADRTRMLGALSHDLRTPITSMRLRLEIMPASEQREKLLRDLDEMQQMTEATLSYVKGAGDVEETRRVDVSALLGSLCEDLQEMGMAVTWAEADQVVLEVRPLSLKRALRNLIENGVIYGQRVDVSLRSGPDSVVVRIEDHGPGIPEDQLESVLEPFHRVEHSRNRSTGGTGLGLSIAKEIINSHGGELILRNQKQGLRVEVILPVH